MEGKTDIRTKLEALAAAPRGWRVTSLYAGGSVKMHDSHSLAGAKNFAIGERRKIGRNLIDRVSGKKVRVIEVTISAI